MLRDKTGADSYMELTTLQHAKDVRERRRDLGIYYTPPEAAKVLARWAIRHRDEKVLEPSFGGCAMLSAAVSVFRSLGNNSPSKQLYGFDIDPSAFEYLAQMGIDGNTSNFKRQDFLCSEAGGLRVDAVLANPPFVSYHRQSVAQREFTNRLREKYFPELPRLASLWVYFILHSMSFLREGGRMAFVLPNAVGSADYAKPLLNHLSNRFEKVELIHVAQRLFIQAGADERISLLLLSGYSSSNYSLAATIAAQSVTNLEDIDLLQDTTNQDADTTNDFRRGGVPFAVEACGQSVTELGCLASVQIGEVVGDIKFFVRPMGEWARRKIDKKYLLPILTRSAQVGGLFFAGALQKNGGELPYILIPPEKKVPKNIDLYLSEYSKENIAGNKTFGKRGVWYKCSYQRDADAFIGSMSHDYPRIIENDAGISCSNAFYKIKLNEQSGLSAWLSIISLTTPFRLSAELLGRVRGSGGVKLEPSDVRRLLMPVTLPILTRAEFSSMRERLNNLVKAGELESATQLADSLVFIKPGLIASKRMNELRRVRLELTNHRLNRSQA